MSKHYSPLRYPGGKSSIIKFVTSILKENDLQRLPYAEPFAGGCGLALGLLYSGSVSELHLNDIDPAIWSFWYCVLNQTDELVSLVQSADLTIDGWLKQRANYHSLSADEPLALGFSAFYLNRTNRSGIIKSGGVIGGFSQSGTYKIDCRFNKDDLVNRIRRVAKYKRRIFLSRLDAVDFIRDISSSLEKKALLCIDPPYYVKGASLYTNSYADADHGKLADTIKKIQTPWVLTYDDAPEIKFLYNNYPIRLLNVKYSAQEKRKSTEIFISSPDLVIPNT